MREKITSLFIATLLLGMPTLASAFCGFYVAKADTGLFNESSQVVMVRDGDRNVMTMSSDFKGDVNEFAMVMPVPTVLKREQIHVTDNAIIEHLDGYSAPRLVEYFDENPCSPPIMYKNMAPMTATAMMEDSASVKRRAKSLGVTIEAQYTVGEYDIMLLSAKQSGGLLTWLTEQGYKLPKGAESVVGSYLKQNMKFFVAKVNLKEFNKSGFTRLRPIQIAYNYQRFMLPIRLGTVNSEGKQELFIYGLSRKGRIETTNYRTVKLASDVEIPAYIKDENQFADFYRDMFRTQVKKENNKAVFLEYAWDMNWCDPCAADPLSNKELRELGVFWVDDNDEKQSMPRRRPSSQAKDVYLTRLHVRYDQQNFPEDLSFQTTGNRENFQGRYIIRHPWKGGETCDAATNYFENILPTRRNKEAKTLANLTGWDINEIREKMKLPKNQLSNQSGNNSDWWKDVWKK